MLRRACMLQRRHRLGVADRGGVRPLGRSGAVMAEVEPDDRIRPARVSHRWRGPDTDKLRYP